MDFIPCKRSFRNLVIMMLFIGLGWSTCGLAQVKVAVIPATWNPQRYRGFLDKVFEDLGWEYKTYENTKLSELMPELKNYNMVFFSVTYNFNYTQDFGKFASEWKAYLESGGCLFLTDINYDCQTQWLSAVDKRLSLGAVRKHPLTVGTKWVAVDHPLMKGVESPEMPWGQILEWGAEWIPLATDTMDRPYVAYQEIGKGLVVVSGCYADHNWPEKEFLGNLLYWTQSPVRLKALKTFEEEINKPELEVPMLSKFPTIDGVLDGDEWSSAAEVSAFIDYVTEASPDVETRCRIAQGPDDLYVLFECIKGPGESASKYTDEKFVQAEREDCVEFFIDPLYGHNSFFNFAVSKLGEKWFKNSSGEFLDHYWLAKVGNDEDRWIVEMRIPFTSLGLTQKMALAKKWAANFVRRHHPGSLESRAFVWTPALTQNELKKKSGLLTGIKADLENYKVNPVLNIKTPEKWLPGMNDVQVDICSFFDIPGKKMLAFKAENSTDDLQSPQMVSLINCNVTSVSFPVKLDIDGRVSGRFVLSDADDSNSILASSILVEAAAEPLMQTDLILPAYRNIIQSKDPKKDLLVCVKIEKADFFNLLLETQVRSQSDDKIVWQESQNVLAGNSFEVKTSLAELPVGSYRVQLKLTSGKIENTILDESEFVFSVLAPAEFEVTFDDRRICYLNGEPFFPIGLYHTSPLFLTAINSVAEAKGLPIVTMESMLEDVKDHGFNVAYQTHAWNGLDEQFLKKSKELGLYSILEIGSVSEPTFKSMVAQANRIGNVLMWYTVDEPNINKIRYALPPMRRMYQRIDPHRPTGAAICDSLSVPFFPEAFDVLMLDLYPFTDKPNLNSTGDRMDKGLAYGKNRRPLWMVPQAFADDRNNLFEPTCQQLSAQAYYDIVHGATGLIWYSYYEAVHAANPKGRGIWFLPDSPLWPFFKELNREVTEISPVILSGEPLGVVKWRSPEIHSAMWIYEGANYMIAVNPTEEKVESSFDGVELKGAEVLFEKRKIPTRNSVLKDTFEPYERHIYKFMQ